MTPFIPAVPRTEHPRPDFHRGLREGTDWLNLNGPWDFAFDPTGVGEQEGWAADPRAPFDREIRVPFCWESHAAWGTEDQAGNTNWFSREVYLDPAAVTNEPARHASPSNYLHAPRHTVGWYRRKVELPPLGADQRLWLHIGAADWSVKVWANGLLVAEGESGYVPFSCDLTEAAARSSQVTLVIRVEDPQDTQDRPLGKQHAWYATTSGIWQTVWLEVRPAVHLTRLHLTPRLSPASVVCDFATSDDAACACRFVVTDAEGQTVGSGESAPDATSVTLALAEPARPWSPASPHLYQVRAELLRDGQVVDTVHSYFGLREVGRAPLYEGGPQYVTLNGEPIYLKGALDQSFNPWGIYTFPTEEAIIADLELARDTGLNFLRIHIKAEDPRFLYWADKLGLLIMADLPNLGYDGYGPTGCRRWEWTFRRVVERDFNHPCIFSWVLFNETWGLGGDAYKQQTDHHAWVESMFHLAHELDATRPIEDNSPCLYDHVLTDLNTWHFYINDYHQAREHVARVVAETHPGSSFNYVPGRVQGDEPLLNSEYGGIGAGSGDKDVSWCFKFLTDLLRAQEQVGGYVYTELMDIEWEYNGFANYDRTPKQFGYSLPDLQGPLYLGVDCPPAQTAQPGQPWSWPLFINTAGYAGAPGLLRRQLAGLDSLGEPHSAEGTLAHLDTLLAGPGVVHHFNLDTGVLPATPCLLRLDAWLGTVAANFATVEVRAGELPAAERLADGRWVLRRAAGHFEQDSAWAPGSVECGVVEGVPHLASGRGVGHFTYHFAVPEELADQPCQKLTVLLEASSRRPGAPQTSAEACPTDLEISLGGLLIGRRTLADQFADARGALSHQHGFEGRYGELVRCEVGAEEASALLDVCAGELILRLEVPADAEYANGLAVYGSRTGSVPCDVTIIIE